MGKEKYEIPEPPPLVHGSTCPYDELECLYEAEARKRARKAPDTFGYGHRPLPHKRCGWWHVYLRHEPGGKKRRARTRREEWALRQALEGNGTD